MQNPYKVGVMPILKMNKLRFRETKDLPKVTQVVMVEPRFKLK